MNKEIKMCVVFPLYMQTSLSVTLSINLHMLSGSGMSFASPIMGQGAASQCMNQALLLFFLSCTHWILCHTLLFKYASATLFDFHLTLEK